MSQEMCFKLLPSKNKLSEKEETQFTFQSRLADAKDINFSSATIVLSSLTLRILDKKTPFYK